MKYEKELNEAGQKWFEANKNGDYAEKQNQATIISQYILQNCKDETEIKAFTEFYIRDFNKFDPDKQKFAAFFSNRFKYRKRDVEKEENIDHDSLNDKISDDDDETTRIDILEGNEQTPENEYLEKERFEDLLTLVTSMRSNISGRANNERKILYYRMFTTDILANFIRSEEKHKELLYKRERDILNSIYDRFLDYFMTEECRTIDQIFSVRIKDSIKDYAHNKVIEPVRLPIQNPVYVSYLANMENMDVGDSAVSEQHKGYKNLIKQLIKNK